MRTTKITIGRLYNLGSYEHIRYDITVELQPGESAEKAMLGLERIINGLAPESKWGVHSDIELDRERKRLGEMAEHLVKLDESAFRARYGHFVGTPLEYYLRCADGHANNVSRRAKAVTRAATARRMLDDIGGASQWKDAKLDWENDDDFDQ